MRPAREILLSCMGEDHQSACLLPFVLSLSKDCIFSFVKEAKRRTAL